MKLKQTKWLIGLAVVATGLAIIIATTLPESTKYYVTVQELSEQPEKFKNEDIKIAGKVVDGTVTRQPKLLRFQMNHENANLWVAYSGAVPDTFKAGADVVVSGKFESMDQFEAHELLAKCASRYEEKMTPTLKSK